MSTINLLPEDYLLKRSQHRANVLCVALFLAIMLGVGGAALVSHQNTRRTEKVRDHVNKQYADAANLLMQMYKLEAQKREGLRKAEATTTLLERVPRSYLLAIVTQSLPSNISMLEVEFQPKSFLTGNASNKKTKGTKFDKLKAKQPTHRRVMMMEISGLAATDVEVADFIANLQRCPILASVDLNYSREKTIRLKSKGKDERNVREFKVTMQVKSNVDVIDLIGIPPSKTAEAPVDPPGRQHSVREDHGSLEGADL